MKFFVAVCFALASLSCACAAGKWTPGYCKHPAKTGLCKARIPKWAYEQKTGLCKFFIYGGCGGNKNQFDSEKECLKVCNPRSRPQLTCSVLPSTRSCRIPGWRWRFNEKKGVCVMFLDFSCGKNPNSFSSCTKCMRTCRNFDGRNYCKLPQNPELGTTFYEARRSKQQSCHGCMQMT
uniref:BPTI/Kunitz inhibitor domain-containing protein n=1 Tax=Amblyomma triste TaxID=251400 RepID=A0A023G2P7_AMBTT